MAHKVDVPSQPWWNRPWMWVIVILLVGDLARRVIVGVLQEDTRPAVTVSSPAAAVSRPAAVSSDLRCAPDETYVTVPMAGFQAVMSPHGDCWTAWYTRPSEAKGLLVNNEGGRLSVEFAFPNGKTEQFLNMSPMQDNFFQQRINGVRFKNTGPNTVSIRIETQR